MYVVVSKYISKAGNVKRVPVVVANVWCFAVL